jgi:hypothetical protein
VRVNQANFSEAFFDAVLQDIVGGLPVVGGVQKRTAISVVDIMTDQEFKEFGFPLSGSPQDVDMGSAVLLSKDNGGIFSAA